MSCNIAAYAGETAHMTASFVRGGVGARNGVAAALMAKVDGEPGFFHSRLGIREPGPEFLSGLGPCPWVWRRFILFSSGGPSPILGILRTEWRLTRVPDAASLTHSAELLEVLSV